MKRVLGIFILLSLVCAGCTDGSFLPPRKELNEMELIRGIAVDKSQDPNLVRLTVMSKKEGKSEGDGSSGGGNGENNKSMELSILTEEGNTIFSAQRKFQAYTDKRLFWGHINIYLIGEGAARDDITKYLDFLSRDNEMRLNSLVYVTKGDAWEILQKSNTTDYFLPDHLQSISSDIKLLSVSCKVFLYEIIGDIDNNDVAAIVIPSVKLIEHRHVSKDKNDRPTQDIEVDGYAIIKDFKLIGFINRPISRGYNFIMNKVGSGAIDTKDLTGKFVSMEIIGSKTTITPTIENGQLTGININTKFETNIDEVHGRTDIFKENSIRYLEQQQSDIVKNEMEEIVKFAKENNADFLKIWKRVQLRHPILWEELKDQWNTIFPKLNITVNVESKINRTYDIRQPSGYKAGEEH